MPTSRKTPQSKKSTLQGLSVASSNSPVKANNPTGQRGGYVKGWATQGKLPRLWRNRIREANIPPSISTSEHEQQASLKSFMDMYFKPPVYGYMATLEELQNNLHTHPLLRIASAFNPITTELKAHKPIDRQRVLDVLTVIHEQNEGLDDQRQRLNTAYACEYIESMVSLLQTNASYEETYIAWYYALLHFKRTGDKYDQYFVNMPSPDEVFGGLEIL